MSVYRNPDLAEWLGCFEGVPGAEIAPKSTHSGSGYRIREVFNRQFQRLGDATPGMMLAVGLAIAGHVLSVWMGRGLLGYEKSPISALALAILLGVVLRNLIGLPSVYAPGLRFCLKVVLRIGVALLGIRLSLMAVGQIGLLALPVVLICIGTTLFVVGRINRWMGLPSRLGSLIAVGTSICGVSAIAATAPVIDAQDDEVSYSVACVALFGLVAMLVYPWFSHWVFSGDNQAAGIFLGTAIHDTAQVAGAGLMYQQSFSDPSALDAAVVTKMIRNLCMIGVVPFIAVLYYQREREQKGATYKPHWTRMVPLFVIGFVAMAAIRTAGDLGEKPFGVIDRGMWNSFVVMATDAASTCLIMAMSAVGLGTDIRSLRRIGWRPFAVGLSAAALVGVVSIGLLGIMRGLL